MAFATSLISEIIKIKCDVFSTPYFGYVGANIPIPEDQLKLCKKTDGEFLRQAEIKALVNGLTYVEEPDEDGSKYCGYLNAEGLWDGVGMLVNKEGDVFMSELKDQQFEGRGKVITDGKEEYWGQHKLWIKEGFGTYTDHEDGEVYTGEWKEDCREG
jgi:hypothetical protein